MAATSTKLIHHGERSSTANSEKIAQSHLPRQAMAALSESERSLEQIAREVGYTDAFSFSKDELRLSLTHGRYDLSANYVWLVADPVDDGVRRLHLRADSDAFIVRGLIAAGYAGAGASGYVDLFAAAPALRADGIHYSTAGAVTVADAIGPVVDTLL